MIDGDDELSRRYGELPKEEPRAAIDQAILASARRAVAPKSFSQRWAVPVSLAAVLVLALGITLRMQLEEPGIETSAPSSQPRTPPASTVDAPAPKEPVAKDASTGAAAEKPRLESKAAPAAPERDLRDERRDRTAKQAKIIEHKNAEETATLEKKSKVEQKTLDANVAAEPAKPAPKAFADAVQSPATPPPAAAPASPPAERFEAQSAARPQVPAQTMAAPDALRAKREAAVGTAGVAKEDAKDPLVKELERIAQLRREGRHQEADEALEKFRKANPSYKIPDALWEQVKPR